MSLQYLGAAHWLIVGGLGLVAAAGHLLAGPPRERRVAALRRKTAYADTGPTPTEDRVPAA